MLLKLTSTDIRDTALLDCDTGEVHYRTSTFSTSASLATPGPSRSSSRRSSRTSRSQEKLPECAPGPVTAVLDRHGEAVAEIVWQGRNASIVRIEDEVLQGTTELFDAAFVRVLPDETFLPTRMEYTWRLTTDTLTLLDDDDVVIGRLYNGCSLVKGRPVPSSRFGHGNDYLELEKLPSDDVLEIIITYLVVNTLRERLYSVTKYVYGQRKRPLATLRRHASRSIANLRDTFRRTISPSSAQL